MNSTKDDEERMYVYEIIRNQNNEESVFVEACHKKYYFCLSLPYDTD